MCLLRLCITQCLNWRILFRTTSGLRRPCVPSPSFFSLGSIETVPGYLHRQESTLHIPRIERFFLFYVQDNTSTAARSTVGIHAACFYSYKYFSLVHYDFGFFGPLVELSLLGKLDVITRRKEVLDWVIPTRLAIQALRTDEMQASHDLSSEEISTLRMAAGQESEEAAATFWMMAMLMHPLTVFGHNVLAWMSACPCNCERKSQCQLKGRRAIEMALGKMKDFVRDLSSLPLNRFALEARQTLQNLNPAAANSLKDQFNFARGNITLRMKQCFSFWEERPWSILCIAECLLDKARDVHTHNS